MFPRIHRETITMYNVKNNSCTNAVTYVRKNRFSNCPSCVKVPQAHGGDISIKYNITAGPSRILFVLQNNNDSYPPSCRPNYSVF